MRKLLIVLTLLVAAASASAVEPGQFATDGWYTWRVAAVDNAPSWCCFEWNSGHATPVKCTLDGRRHGFGGDHSDLPASDEIQVYGQISGGEVVRVRALSPACPVASREPVSDLGRVDSEVSLGWLRPLAKKADSDALPAIAMHRGPAALAFVTDLANNGNGREVRKDAVFWLGQVRIAEAEDTVVGLMFRDGDPEMREAAAFSLSQSSAPDRAELLIRQGREDDNADVRGQALFWLAQTGAPQSEAAIFDALGTAADDDAREAAVFALSQLPDERAVASLVRIVTDRNAERHTREQALFWLVQSDSDEASDAIDRLFSTSR